MLEHRREVVSRDDGSSQPHVCPQCGGTDWLFSAECIRPEPAGEPWRYGTLLTFACVFAALVGAIFLGIWLG